uniref:Major outer membrane protein P28-18 n=1 Tax=Ehrlichia muris TaxID=35795 RepID=Q1WEW3_9RICK|nr:major outer membrane protein P28-18 [Ehrlichia muris AS145]
MNCKKLFITNILISLMSFFPGVSVSDAVQIDNVGGYFLYQWVICSQRFSLWSIFSYRGKKSYCSIIWVKTRLGRCRSISTYCRGFKNKGYSFKYENNPFLGFAGAIGYSMGGPRVEFEVSYETFDVKNQGNNYKNDAHKYCALDQQATSSSNATKDKYVLLKNEGLLDISFMLNACYDIITDGIPFSPYICAGIGTDLVSMFETTNPKISYQGKLGLSYSISPEASVFVGGHFHKVIGSEFKDIPTLKAFAASTATPDMAIVTLSVCHFGIELGGRFSF